MTALMATADDADEDGRPRSHGRRLAVLARYDRRVRFTLIAAGIVLCSAALVAFLSSTAPGVGPRGAAAPLASRSSPTPRLNKGHTGGASGKDIAGGGAFARRFFTADGAAASSRDQERGGDGDGDGNGDGGSNDCEAYGCPLRPYDVEDWPPQPEPEGSPVFGTETLNAQRRQRRRWCGATQRGNQHPHNQDRAVVLSPFRFRRVGRPSTDGGGGDDKAGGIGEGGDRRDDDDDYDGSFLIGIFDGHGDQGHTVAEHVIRDLPERIAGKLRALLVSGGDAVANNREEEIDPVDVARVLTESFLECDAAAPGPAALDGGSTASIVLGLGGERDAPGRRRIYTANVGDSLSFVGALRTSDDGGLGLVDIANRTIKHKPHLPLERSRIESMGGHVHIPPPPKNPAMARAVVYNSYRGEAVGLAMSRSLGDWEHGAAGVIAEPTVEVWDVERLRRRGGGDTGDGDGDGDGDGGAVGELFAVAVSDGVTDSRKPELVANKVARYLFAGGGGDGGGTGEGPANTNANAKDGCLDAIEVATPKNTKWYRDDMTLVALRIG